MVLSLCGFACICLCSYPFIAFSHPRTLRQWASGALFHTQMLVQLAELEGRTEKLAAKAVLEQYQEDLNEIIYAYRYTV